MPHPTRRAFMLSTLAFSTLALTACGQREPEVSRSGYNPPLFPNETPELRQLINKWADTYQIPRELVHRQAIRESTHRPEARNGPYYGLLQILPQTARTMGHSGPASELLDPNVNLKYAGKYLRGAYIVADGDVDTAMKWYAKGYYYEAKKKGLLYETGLRS
ncbi:MULTISPECIES: lytic transglycosylase domain-containing protein [Roseobacteraceae]|uniref:lytic transglycosylase domain-containing protein n=1 Tax=Roseobacteraceae TaxID=2854170 RepID=UPI00186A7C18|nr:MULTISPECIES: lytic transglycosylase domain-containing protein [Roseobacteraceae]|tara:strand:+ start:15572 stop:16057 length:486 start_codon:yes stop_codon:yes gene_type:complete